MFTLLMAGHETTATSLAWVFHHVLPRPDVLEKLRDELDRVLGGAPVAPEHVPRLEYLDPATPGEDVPLDGEDGGRRELHQKPARPVAARAGFRAVASAPRLARRGGAGRARGRDLLRVAARSVASRAPRAGRPPPARAERGGP